eukprot:111131_1
MSMGYYTTYALMDAISLPKTLLESAYTYCTNYFNKEPLRIQKCLVIALITQCARESDYACVSDDITFMIQNFVGLIEWKYNGTFQGNTNKVTLLNPYRSQSTEGSYLLTELLPSYDPTDKTIYYWTVRVDGGYLPLDDAIGIASTDFCCYPNSSLRSQQNHLINVYAITGWSNLVVNGNKTEFFKEYLGLTGTNYTITIKYIPSIAKLSFYIYNRQNKLFEFQLPKNKTIMYRPIVSLFCHYSEDKRSCLLL